MTVPQQTAPAAVATSANAAVAPHVGHGGGLFGRRRHLEAEQDRLTAENTALRGEIQQLQAQNTRLLGMNPERIKAEIAAMHASLADAKQQAAAAQQELVTTRQQVQQMQAQVVQTEEIALLQEAGLYQYLHPLEDAVAYKGRLQELNDRVKAMIRAGQAVLATTNWTVNGSAREGKAMVRDFSKLMLRAYNAEADNCVRNVRPHRVQAMIDRLSKVRETIARLGKTMDINIAQPYHDARIQEIRLTADYLGKVEEEKERVRAERERQREEERARREFEREKVRLAKEQSHYLSALAKLRAANAVEGTEELQSKLDEIAAAIAGVEAREANRRAGYVYVISNIGAFGPNMIKIGMTRRLEPQDRIRELGDASVPFRFDTHALIFSDDAVELETRLHTELAGRKVNQINTQREFFYATPADVRKILQRIAGQHLLEYREVPEAVEWRASQRVADPVQAG